MKLYKYTGHNQKLHSSYMHWAKIGGVDLNQIFVESNSAVSKDPTKIFLCCKERLSPAYVHLNMFSPVILDKNLEDYL